MGDADSDLLPDSILAAVTHTKPLALPPPMWTNGIYDGHGKTKMGLQYSIPDMPMFETETNPKTPRRNVGFGDTSIDEYTSLFGGIDYHSSILQLQSPMSRPPGGFTLPVSALGYPFLCSCHYGQRLINRACLIDTRMRMSK